jgi:CubicO group peptidase (beta-lactamase class C family)
MPRTLSRASAGIKYDKRVVLRPIMRPLIAAVGLAAALAIGVPLHAADSLVLTRFGDYLEALRVNAGVPGMVATIVGINDVAYERTFGQQDLERSVATRMDTPFHVEGLTQTMTAVLVLRCAEEGRISLDDQIVRFAPGDPDEGATVRQILTHTTTSGQFVYQPQRFDVLKTVVDKCTTTSNTTGSFRVAVNSTLERFQMNDSVPGPDAVGVPASPNGIGQAAIDRFKANLERLAVPYAVDTQKRVTKSQYPTTGLRGGAGLISSARDYARFDLALKAGSLLSFDGLSVAWTPLGGRPHGLGWFVQNFNGEKVVWSFGQGDNASSSLVVILPARSMTLVLLANSDGLSKSFNLANGDVTTSPFAKLFLELFVK